MFRSVKQLQSLSEGLTLKLLHACRHIVHASEILCLSERYTMWVSEAAPAFSSILFMLPLLKVSYLILQVAGMHYIEEV